MEKRQLLLMLAVVLTTAVTVVPVLSSHFRGGSINWRWEGGTKVHFYFRLGWTYGGGPGCRTNLMGQLVTGMSSNYWTCQIGNCGTSNLHNVNYYCTGANQAENWEQGKNDFTYTFPGTGPFTIGYSSSAWIGLSNGQGSGMWNIATTVDLRTRSDTGTPNSSPESQSKPMHYVQYGCEIRLKLPVVDADDDTIRCRWSIGSECQTVCSALPGAYLDEDECIIVFNTTSTNSYIKNGVYAVAVTIEDYPKVPMTIGGNIKKTPSDALSSVALQFLVKSIPPTSSCDAGPRFVPPTPGEKEIFTVEEGDLIDIEVFADNGNDTSAKANVITASGPVTMTQSGVIPDVNRTNTFTTTLSWSTTHNDVGNNIVCASIANDKGKSGDPRCFVIKVVPKGCQSSPCQNSGKCVAAMGNYTCICRPGFTGHDCDVDIDECVSNVCPSGTYCVDSINTYTCSNMTTTTTTTQMTTTEKNYTGMCPLEYEHCDCVFSPTKNDKNRMGLSRLERDFLGFFFGFPIGLILSAGIYFYFLVFKPYQKLKRFLTHKGIFQRKPKQRRRVR